MSSTSMAPPRAVAPALLLLAPLTVLALAAGVAKVPAQLAALLAVGALSAVLAHRSPRLALLTLLAVVVVVPLYAGRYATGSLGITPMTAGALVLLPAAAVRARGVRWVALDAAVLALVLLRVVAYLLNYSGGTGAAAGLVLSTALPYAVFRVLALDRRVPRMSAAVLLAGATVLSIVALRERAGVTNPFFQLAGDYQVQQWVRPELRFGEVRAEASFGHPIAFGMFLSFVLVLALALALTTRRPATRAVVLSASGLLVVALAATLSRGPLVVAAVGIAWYVLAVVRRVPPLRVLVLVGAAGLLVVTTPVLPTVQALRTQSSGDTREARSAEYRLEVLSVALDERQFSLLGRESKAVAGVQGALVDRTGLKSVDSEFAVVYLASGALALGALLTITGLLVRTAVRPRLDGLERAWAVGMAACCLNFVTVALLTQEAELFWAGVGLVAAIEQRRRTTGATT